MIFIILSILLALAPSPDCLELDIMLVGDFSGSVQGREHFISEAFESFGGKFKLSETGINIGVITFGSNSYLISELTSSQEALERSLVQMRQVGAEGSTNMTSALQLASVTLAKGRPNVQDVIIIVSDGVPDERDKVLMVAQQIKQFQRCMVCTILVDGGMIDEEFLKNLSSNCYVRTDYESLAEEIKELDMCL